jgi:hypothetical protein
MRNLNKLLAATAMAAAAAFGLAGPSHATVFVNDWSIFPDGEITVNFGDGGTDGLGSADASGEAGDHGTLFTHTYDSATGDFTDTFDFLLPTGTVFNIASSTSTLTFTGISFNGHAGTFSNLPHDETANVGGVIVLDGGMQHLVVSGNGVSSSGWSGTASFVPVPEPATWGLMIMGFGGMGVMLRNRRRVAAV